MRSPQKDGLEGSRARHSAVGREAAGLLAVACMEGEGPEGEGWVDDNVPGAGEQVDVLESQVFAS